MTSLRFHFRALLGPASLGLALLACVLGYRAYYPGPDPGRALPDVSPVASPHAGVASRAVLFIVNGFHPGHAFDAAVMPTLAELAAAGASGIARTDAVTTTAPRMFSMMTGLPARLAPAHEVRAHSLPSLVAASGRGIALAGDPTWIAQFSWLTPPADRHEVHEDGTQNENEASPADEDTAAVEFVLAKLADPRYGLAVVHLGSVDDVGHTATPHGKAYLQQLGFVDGLLRRVRDAVDPRTTLLLVTGDHGMASQGTHGGEEQARRTPYVLVGPEVRAGAIANVPQTALAATLLTALGLPMPPISEHGPVTALFSWDEREARERRGAYFDAKVKAAGGGGLPLGLTPDTDEALLNRRLNEDLFERRAAGFDLRLLTVLVAAVGLAAGLVALRVAKRRPITGTVASPRSLARAGLVIFLLALVVRLGWVLSLPDAIAWPDEREFLKIARRLVAGHGFVSTSYRANPVFPAFLAGVFGVFGESLVMARGAQAVLGALTCLVVFRTATVLIGPAAGTLTGLMLAVYPPHIYLSGVFYVECIYTFLCALSLHLGIRTLGSRHRFALACLCGLACGAATLTRAIFVVYVPFLAAALLWAAWPAWRRQLVACAVIVLTCAATILPWTLRNYAVYGRVIAVSSGFGTKLWQGNNELADGGAHDRELTWDTPDWRARLARLDPVSQARIGRRYAEIARRVSAVEVETGDRYLASDAVLGPLALEYMAMHPQRTAELFLRKIVTLFSAFSKTITTNGDGSDRNRLVATVVYYPIFVLALAGAWIARDRHRALGAVYLFIVVTTVVYGLLNTCTRFRLPLDPYLVMFAAVTLVHLGRRSETVRLFVPARASGDRR
jgi:4-amino-4-deoxy-L-arabinose transferase-like glycosyltransferase